MILVIENVDKNLCIAIKNVVKLTDAKMKIQKEPSDELLEAMKEVEEMKKHPERYKSYKSVEEMFEDLNKWLNIKLNSQKLSNGLTKKIKHNRDLSELLQEIIMKLANDEKLDAKYNDHNLSGNYKDYRECHIKLDLLLIYKRKEDILILTCVDLGSHSELFKK